MAVNFPGKDLGNVVPHLEKYTIPALVFLLAYTSTDLALLSFRSEMLPTEVPPTKSAKMKRSKRKSAGDYFTIVDRNIFNSDGKIPPALSEGEGGEGDTEGPAVASNLPLKLLGTIVHVNEKKSVASIESRRSNRADSFMVGEDIEGLAEVIRVERRKVIFRNKSNRRLEYIEIPKDAKINLGLSSAPTTDKFADNDLVKELGRNNYEVNRKDVVDLTKDLSGLLRQARVTQNVVPGSGGRIEGFRFTWIKPGSPFEKLGFKVGDVIKGVEGEPINDPRKAMEAYNALKTSDNLRLTISRDGRDEELSYSIKE